MSFSQNRAADIAAETDNNVGLEIFDDFFRLSRRAEKMRKRDNVPLDVFERELTVKAGNFDRFEIEARGRNQL